MENSGGGVANTVRGSLLSCVTSFWVLHPAQGGWEEWIITQVVEWLSDVLLEKRPLL